ncbi:sulfite exporter TauE/SafE family protein [Geofilum rubicundum]|uniref:Probable membrane transporter protein n=1 Tax=Geofilum rubicundum JCM 15548 TaxID=1236989 RepID=A0A0E9LZG8_9BACT|nr:sulfite exporter TauE/SafE family protein [Geofilum rubicundum]GAO30703.1 possible sulfoacetate exporter [Geofilum rubicundum JCM 15548]
MTLDYHIALLLILALPLAAFFYASVGHGGASSYLMLMTLLSFPINEIRPTALVLNIVISGLAFITFRKTAPLNKPLFLSLILFSMPAAWLGGLMEADPLWYKRILGFLLIFPALRFFNLLPAGNKAPIIRTWWMAPLAGLSIGFLSGIIGIGGGILLSPLLLLAGWAEARQTATISALFILLNSVAGLAGVASEGLAVSRELWYLLPLAIAGGILGAWYGAFRTRPQKLKYLLATVLLIAAVKLIGL